MTRARSALTVAVALGALAAAPAAATALPGFQTPSGNIHCMGYGGELRCDIRTTTNGRPQRPRRCEFDWGTAYATKRGWRRGRRLCVSDTVYDPAHHKVAYGHSWAYAGVVCRSEARGLTCRNPGGHGFFLSQGSQRLF